MTTRAVTAAATTFALSFSVATAFQASLLAPPSGIRLGHQSLNNPVHQRQSQSTTNNPISRAGSCTALRVLAEVDFLLQEETSLQDQSEKIAELYFHSQDEDFLPHLNQLEAAEDRFSRPVRFNTVANTSKGRGKVATLRAKKTNGRSRSSTMPGLSGQSDRQRAYRDGIRIVEERTGKRFQDSPEARRSRRKQNGEAMYKNSAAVPDSLVKFADEIHQEDRISRAEEIELGEKTQEAIRIQNVYDQLQAKLQRKPTDEEWCAASGKINMEALSDVIDEGLAAKNKLVTSNLRMVQSVVNTYIRNGLSAQYNAGDMMQEGILALIRAAEKFEPDRGWKFSTYAMYWVRASVKRSQIFQSRLVPVPQRLYENHKRLMRVEREMMSELGRKPTMKELGDAVGMSELQVERCLTAMSQQCVSLDQEIKNRLKPSGSDREKDTLVELIESRTDDGEHNVQRREMVREALIEALHRHLKPDEVELLLLRYGLIDGPREKLGRQLTIAELSRIVGLKPDKVRRTIDRSLKQLKAVGVDEWLAYDRELS